MSSPRAQLPLGFHLVGSVPLLSTDEVFHYISRAAVDHVLRIPDGETGTRWNFVMWQQNMLPERTRLSIFTPEMGAQLAGTVPEDEIRRMGAEMQNFETRYDEAAIESYKIFRKLKDEGIIPQRVRFQVSLPTPLNVMVSLKPPYRSAVEPLYEAALLRSLARIQAQVPEAELAIQWDLALDMGMIEGLPWLKPWFDGPVLDGVVERVVRLANRVAIGVDVGFHLCYGDSGHKHFMEPVSMSAMVDVANAILKNVERPVEWFHMPVPKARNDLEYFAPLRGLSMPQETMLYLGLVHANDNDGTVNRIKAAEQAGFNGRFGVATECGLGRTPVAELDSIFQILKDVSDPVA
jgi:hypothetical protein